jgi:hypothetical protein
MASAEGKEALSKEKANAAKALEDSESESSDYPRANTARVKDPQWYLDSCALIHLTARKDQFITKIQPVNTSMEIADSSTVGSKGKGNVKIAYVSQNGKQRSTIVKEVHYIPQAESSLLSVGEFEDSGAQVVVDSPGKTVTITRDGKELLYGQRKHRVWCVNQRIKYRSCSAMQSESTLRKELDNTKDIVQGTSDTADTAAKETISGTCKPEGKPIPKVPTKLLHARLGHPGRYTKLGSALMRVSTPMIRQLPSHRLCSEYFFADRWGRII